MPYRSKYHFLAQKKMLPLVGIYENQMISKGLKTNYFAPTKIHTQYKQSKYIIVKNNHQK